MAKSHLYAVWLADLTQATALQHINLFSYLSGLIIYFTNLRRL